VRIAPSAIVVILLLTPTALSAGGPKYVAGTTYFDPAIVGQPVRWAAGIVKYYVDQGSLTPEINNQQATAMVDAAAALWSAIPSAGVLLKNSGALAEDVSGGNVTPGDRLFGNATFAAPSDVAATATNFPLAMIGGARLSIGPVMPPITAILTSAARATCEKAAMAAPAINAVFMRRNMVSILPDFEPDFPASLQFVISSQAIKS